MGWSGYYVRRSPHNDDVPFCPGDTGALVTISTREKQTKRGEGGGEINWIISTQGGERKSNWLMSRKCINLSWGDTLCRTVTKIIGAPCSLSVDVPGYVFTFLTCSFQMNYWTSHWCVLNKLSSAKIVLRKMVIRKCMVWMRVLILE